MRGSHPPGQAIALGLKQAPQLGQVGAQCWGVFGGEPAAGPAVQQYALVRLWSRRGEGVSSTLRYSIIWRAAKDVCSCDVRGWLGADRLSLPAALWILPTDPRPKAPAPQQPAALQQTADELHHLVRPRTRPPGPAVAGKSSACSASAEAAEPFADGKFRQRQPSHVLTCLEGCAARTVEKSAWL